MKLIAYPTPERIMEYNLLALSLVKAKKADKSEVLSYKKLADATEECKTHEGDIYDKAVFLLKRLIQGHPFAIGNRRTAFIVAKDFLLSNGGNFAIHDNPEQARVMLGIRETYYTDAEIKGWIKNGEIRQFKR